MAVQFKASWPFILHTTKTPKSYLCRNFLIIWDQEVFFCTMKTVICIQKTAIIMNFKKINIKYRWRQNDFDQINENCYWDSNKTRIFDDQEVSIQLIRIGNRFTEDGFILTGNQTGSYRKWPKVTEISRMWPEMAESGQKWPQNPNLWSFWNLPRQASTIIIPSGSKIVHKPNIKIDWDKIVGKVPTFQVYIL